MRWWHHVDYAELVEQTEQGLRQDKQTEHEAPIIVLPTIILHDESASAMLPGAD
jgi:hypothetical protein